MRYWKKFFKLLGAALLTIAVMVSGINLAWFVPWNEPQYPDDQTYMETGNTGGLYSPDGFPAYQGDWADGFAHGTGESFYESQRRQAGGVEYSGQWQSGISRLW